MPVKHGSIGPAVADIGKLYGQTGMFTYDPGFTSTASCESKITYIDGDEGVLLYRGYPIEQLAEHGDFLETCYLLLYGELPTASAEGRFRLSHHAPHHGARADGEVLPRLPPRRPSDGGHGRLGRRALGLLSRLDRYFGPAAAHDRHHAHHRQNADDGGDGLQVQYRPALHLSRRTTSTIRRTSCACASRVPCEEYKVNPVLSRALDRIFILHADHEQNASTSTVRLAGSSGANPFACIAAGIACLWGPAHGGANEAALKMLSEIGSVENIPKYIAKAKDKNDPFRLMGFGHRVYKNYDPRAKIMAEDLP